MPTIGGALLVLAYFCSLPTPCFSSWVPPTRWPPTMAKLSPNQFAAAAVTIGFGFAAQCFALVGDGDLPYESLGFVKLLKSQKDIRDIISSLDKTDTSSLENQLFSTRMFLRGLAQEYEDMQHLADRIADKDKQASAKTAASEFRESIRAGDKAAAAKEIVETVTSLKHANDLLSTYLSSLHDVPDEL